MTLTDINFECSTCGQRLVVEAIAAGTEVACPLCSGALKVPGSSSSGLAGKKADKAAERRERSDATELDRLLAEDRTFAEPANGLFNEPAIRDLEAPGGEARSLRQERDRAEATQVQTVTDLRREQTVRAALAQDLERERSARRTDAEAWAQRVQELETTIAQLRLAHSATATKLEHLLAEKQTLLEALNISQTRVLDVEVQLKAREQEVVERDGTLDLLKGELREAEQAMARLQLELAALRELPAAKEALEEELAQVQQRLVASEEGCATLTENCRQAYEGLQKLQAELQTLHSGLRESEQGRELIALQQQLRTAEEARSNAERRQRNAEEEYAKAGDEAGRLREEVESLRRRCHQAELQAEASSTERLENDLTVLRGIIQRQETELSERHGELLRLRRARLGVRLAYTLVALCTFGLLALGFVLLQRVL